MNAAERVVKQITILIVLLLILGSFGFGAYKFFEKPPLTPTPTPLPQLAPIGIVSTRVFDVGNNDYDFLARVRNPNQSHGSGGVEYELVFFGSDSEAIERRVGSFYILPGQTKYVIDAPIKLNFPFTRHEFRIKSVSWVKVDRALASSVSLFVRNAEYFLVNRPGLYARATGTVNNNSDFDLGRVDVAVVAMGESERPLAVNRTSINTFLAGNDRSFEVRWPRPFLGNYNRLDIEINTNVFEDANFLRRAGETERFQQFY